MKQIIYIFVLALFACNGRSENVANKNSEDSLNNKDLETQPFDTIEPEYIPVFSISKINRDFPFDNWLSKLNDIDSLNRFESEVDAIKKSLIKQNDLKDTFSLTYMWTLNYYEYFGWTEHFGGQGPIDSLNQKYLGKYKTVILTSKEIFDVFKISHNPTFPLDSMPVIYERDALFNGEWTAIYLSNDYLIIRWVGSYPHGNQTSWYYEKVYYFKRHSLQNCQ